MFRLISHTVDDELNLRRAVIGLYGSRDKALAKAKQIESDALLSIELTEKERSKAIAFSPCVELDIQKISQLHERSFDETCEIALIEYIARIKRSVNI